MGKLQSHDRKGENEVCQKAEPLLHLLERRSESRKIFIKNRCLHPECAETHHTSLHDYFKKKVEETAVKDAKVRMSKLAQVQKIYLQIVPIKVRATHGEYISTYALLDTGSERTLIRSDFAKRLNLRKNSKIVNISSIKDSGELINVDEVKLYVMDGKNTSTFYINKA